MAKAKATKFKPYYSENLITPVGRLIWRALAEPEQFMQNGKPKGEPKYYATIVCKPGEKLTRIFAQCDKAHKMSFPDRAEIALPYVSGEDAMAKNEKCKPEIYAGKFVLKASGSAEKEPPQFFAKGCLDPMINRAGNAEDKASINSIFYPGCYVRLAVTVFSYVGFGDGVSMILKGVRFHDDGAHLVGEPITGEIFNEEAEDDYADDEEDAGVNGSGYTSESVEEEINT